MWPKGIPLGEFGLLCVPVFGVQRVCPVCHGAVTHRRERRSCCEPAAAASALGDSLQILLRVLLTIGLQHHVPTPTSVWRLSSPSTTT